MATTGLVVRRGPLRPLLAAGAALAGTAYVGLVDPNQPGHYPTCPFYFITGLYCPGCGSLRAVHALAHGDVVQALHRNPLTMIALVYLAWAWVGWLRRSTVGGPPARMAPPALIWALVIVVLAFWVLRNVPAFAWLAP